MKTIKRIGIGLLALIVIFILGSYCFHSYKLNKENALLLRVEQTHLNKQDGLHVYTEGEGEKTYVFLAGNGVGAPQYDFKSLYTLFSTNEKIAVVDRLGYGLSEKRYESRDIANIVEQSREALRHHQINPPYIIVAHSISGLEALYWAQHYPDEVEAIIGLDIGLPSNYIEYELSSLTKVMFHTYQWLTTIGIHRFIPSLAYNESVIANGNLTEDEIALYKAISYKQGFNKNMKEEILLSKQNSEQIIATPLPHQTPLLLIDAYLDIQSDAAIKNIMDYENFSATFTHSKVVRIQGGHSIYLHAPNEIYNETIQFLNTIHLDKK